MHLHFVTSCQKWNLNPSLKMYHIQVDEMASPVIHPPQPKAQTHTRPDKLEAMAVGDPKDWVNSLVVVVKNELLRLCLDPKDLNRAVNHQHHGIPTAEVASTLKGNKVFTILDEKNGFWKVQP